MTPLVNLIEFYNKDWKTTVPDDITTLEDLLIDGIGLGVDQVDGDDVPSELGDDLALDQVPTVQMEIHLRKTFL